MASGFLGLTSCRPSSPEEVIDQSQVERERELQAYLKLNEQIAGELERLIEKSAPKTAEAPAKDQEKEQAKDQARDQAKDQSKDEEQDSPWILLEQFYKARQYEPLWTADSSRETGISLLRAAREFGLDPERYLDMLESKGNSTRDKARQELALSSALLHLGRDLAVGRFNPDTLAQGWKSNERIPDLLSLLHSAPDSAIMAQALRTIQPANPLYHLLQGATARFVRSFALEDSSMSVPVQNKDSALALSIAREVLLMRGYMDSLQWSSDSLSLRALRQFQRLHGLHQDGVIGPNTALALGRSNADRYRSLAITLERWRWERKWEQPFVWVCMPAFELQRVEGDSVSATHRVVVGTLNTPTPDISSRINLVVPYPYWNVPYSISTQEILPKVQSDPSYLSRNRYTLRSQSGQTLDASSVDWSALGRGNFPYLIRQEGGSSNALGLVKFLFPNPHSVYLHDTNAKSFFEREVRAFSHGCVRLDRPMELAEYLLANFGGEADMSLVERRIAERREQHISLDPGLPIYLRHFTARGTDSLPTFHTDLYGKDAEFLRMHPEFK